MPVLDVQNLSIGLKPRRGPPLTAVDDVSFSVEAGEILGLVGESGAGKSITGMSVIGLLDPPLHQTGGAISLEGTRIDTLSQEEMRRLRGRRIGAIFQDPLTSLDPLFTVGQQLVETILTHLDLTPPAARRRALDLLDEVGIPAAEDRLNSYPHEFSGGMRQRVVIALALACEPRLIIADEPTTALDVSIQAQIVDLIRRLTDERGTAVVLITHDMGVIAEATDRVAVMYAGRIVEIGATQAVLGASHHPYTRGLMASIPEIGRGERRLDQIDGSMPALSAMPPGCPFHPRCPIAIPTCSEVRPTLEQTETTQAACLRAGDVSNAMEAADGRG